MQILNVIDTQETLDGQDRRVVTYKTDLKAMPMQGSPALNGLSKAISEDLVARAGDVAASLVMRVQADDIAVEIEISGEIPAYPQISSFLFIGARKATREAATRKTAEEGGA